MPNDLSAAWEWRCFWVADEYEGVSSVAATLAQRFGADPPRHTQAEEDTYVVVQDVRHNLKVRRGALELKVQLCRRAGGLSLWEDTRVWPFPLDDTTTRQLWSWIADGWPPPTCAPRSPAELVWRLQQQERGIATVLVRKQRVRLELTGGRLEVASLVLPGPVRLLSCCVDSYDLGAVRELVGQTRLPPHARTLSYPELLRTAGWWRPALGQGKAAA